MWSVFPQLILDLADFELNSLYFKRNTCRLCESRDLKKAISLSPTPLANSFVPKSALGISQPLYPLDVYFCNACTHVQLLDVVDPKVLYQNYIYVSGTSPVFVHHFKAYAEYIVSRFNIPPGSFVFEIGSNDGTLLRCFMELGMRVMGIDPAQKIAAGANNAGIETRLGFFDLQVAQEISHSRGKAAVIAANNVLAHIDNLASVLENVTELLADDGIFVFEVSYLLDVVQKNLFDTIYHEHLDYHSVKPLVGFFRKHGLELIEVSFVESHGGSLRGVAQLSRGPRKVDASIQAAIAREESAGLGTFQALESFCMEIDTIKAQLTGLLKNLKQEGKRIAAFGAPAKATTLMYHFGLGPDVIDFIVDDSPLKQGLFAPGSHIPVYASSEIYARNPDYLVVLAWNFAESIINKHAQFRTGGGRFIVPLPMVSVI